MAIWHEEESVDCSECHGSSLDHRQDEDNVTPPDILYRRTDVEYVCLRCHEAHDDMRDHIDKPLPKVAVCTDCHGEHKVLHE